MANDEEAGMAAPRSHLEQLPGSGRYSLTGVHAWAMGGRLCKCRQLQQSRGGNTLGIPRSLRRWSRPGHSVPCQLVMTQSVTPGRYCETFAATETPLHPLCQAHQPVPRSRCVVGNMVHAAFSRNVLSGHVSEPHALGQAGCSCLTASCHATALAGRV